MWAKEGDPLWNTDSGGGAGHTTACISRDPLTLFLQQDCGVSLGLQAQAHEEANEMEVDGGGWLTRAVNGQIPGEASHSLEPGNPFVFL